MYRPYANRSKITMNDIVIDTIEIISDLHIILCVQFLSGKLISLNWIVGDNETDVLEKKKFINR